MLNPSHLFRKLKIIQEFFEINLIGILVILRFGLSLDCLWS